MLGWVNQYINWYKINHFRSKQTQRNVDMVTDKLLGLFADVEIDRLYIKQKAGEDWFSNFRV